jgi:DNA repair protein RadC
MFSCVWGIFVVHDHVVIGKSGNTSFKTAGLL